MLASSAVVLADNSRLFVRKGNFVIVTRKLQPISEWYAALIIAYKARTKLSHRRARWTGRDVCSYGVRQSVETKLCPLNGKRQESNKSITISGKGN